MMHLFDEKLVTFSSSFNEFFNSSYVVAVIAHGGSFHRQGRGAATAHAPLNATTAAGLLERVRLEHPAHGPPLLPPPELRLLHGFVEAARTVGLALGDVVVPALLVGVPVVAGRAARRQDYHKDHQG